jgi:ribose 5-phosphate isomerase A
VVGLGTGHAAVAFVQALAARVQRGLKVRGVATSKSTSELATRLGIPLATPEEFERIDVTVDGADEVDPKLDLIKGLGGALVREKIIAAATKFYVVVVGSNKLVPALGAHGTLPVEVLPFALPFCRRKLIELQLHPEPRMSGGALLVTDNGNHIFDCRITPLADAAGTEHALRAIPGVVGTGLFLGMANVVLVQEGETVHVMQRPSEAAATRR